MMDLLVRQYTPADLATVDRVMHGVFGSPLARFGRVLLECGAAIGAIAERDGAAAGFGIATPFGISGYVGPFGVLPDARRSGVGSALMRSLLESCEARGVRSLQLDASDMGAPLYATFGFVDVDRTLVFEREAAATPGTPPAAGDHAARADALALDAEIFGCDRSAVLGVYFDAPKAIFVRTPGAYLVAHGATVGPFLARTAADAAEAYRSFAALGVPVTRWFVPESNMAAVALAESAGFASTRSLRHMRRGDSPVDRTRVFGQAGLDHG